MIAKIVMYEVHPKHLDKCKELTQEFAQAVHYSEPGTRIYISLQDRKNRNSFKHIMLFESEMAEEIHANSSLTIDYTKKINTFCRKKPIFEAFDFIGGI